MRRVKVNRGPKVEPRPKTVYLSSHKDMSDSTIGCIFAKCKNTASGEVYTTRLMLSQYMIEGGNDHAYNHLRPAIYRMTNDLPSPDIKNLTIKEFLSALEKYCSPEVIAKLREDLLL